MFRTLLHRLLSDLLRSRSTPSTAAGEAEKPLLDSGMDSKAAVQFSTKPGAQRRRSLLSAFVGSYESTTPKIIRLARELPDLRLPSTLVFDYPTLSAGPTACVLSLLCLAAPTSQAVAAYAEEAQRPRERKHREITKQPVASSDPLSVIGGACAFPGRE